MNSTSVPGFTPGVEVEVRTRYLSNWAAGFVVVSVEGDWVGLRRRSDGAILPVAIPAKDIRPRRRSDQEHPRPVAVSKQRRFETTAPRVHGRGREALCRRRTTKAN